MTDLNGDLPVGRYMELGLKCSWLGRDVRDMTREELISFIGMLDEWVTHLTLNNAQPAKGEA